MEKDAPQIDTIFQGYDRTLYKRGYDDPIQDQLAQMSADSGANNSTAVNVPSDSIGSGQSTDMSSVSTGGMMSGKQAFGDNTAGFFLGIDTDGVAKWNFGNSTNFINWNGLSLVVTGSLTAGSLNIPDTTTANSFHVDTSGNTWWGSNVATGYTGANAYVLNTGMAVFKSPQIGGNILQYTVTNSGIFSFGDGSDGVANFDGSSTPSGSSKSSNTYTLTRDVYYTTMTVSDGIDVITNGYRIFCTTLLTIGGGTSGKIHWDGNSGTAGQDGALGGGGAKGVGGAALTNGYLVGALVAGDGGAGTAGNTSGINGTGVSNALNTSNGSNGGTGGAGGGGGTVAGIGGTTTGSNVKLIANWHLATLLDISSSGSTVKFTGSASSGGGGAGAQNVPANGGGGGGAGSNGGVIAIYAKIITINSGASVTSNGGNGGNGGNGVASGSSNGGGGGGGNGGIILLAYNTITNSGSLTAIGGTGGTKGNISVGGTDATNGSNGSVGTIFQFILSL